MFASHPVEDEDLYETTRLGSFSATDDVEIMQSGSFSCYGDTPNDASLQVGSCTEFSMPFSAPTSDVLEEVHSFGAPSDSDDGMGAQYTESPVLAGATATHDFTAEENITLTARQDHIYSSPLYEDVRGEDVISGIEQPGGMTEAASAREAAQRRAFFAEESLLSTATVPTSSSGPDFRLLSYDINEMGIENGNDDDFVTGNVTTLKTGTDDVIIPPVPLQQEEESDEEKEEAEPLHYIVDPDPSFFEYRPTLGDYSHYSEEKEHLVPLLCRDFWHNFLTYTLAVTLCALCLLKVYQVQETRDVTARLNEISLNNVGLKNQWLSLVAVRQNLSEHDKIREYATEKLHMVSPKTENEQVIENIIRPLR